MLLRTLTGLEAWRWHRAAKGLKHGETNLAYRTLETVLHPDSHLALPLAELPLHPVRVMVTILEDDETDSLADRGDDVHEILATCS